MAAEADRGRLIVSARVIEKIAGQAASELAEAGRRQPKVTTEVNGDAVVLQVQLGVAFPAPIRRTAQELQRRLSERVGRLTGLRVTRVDVDVAWLYVDDGTGRSWGVA